jgi:hypothetical protein|tara:strand:- start:2712 stop:2888 length:177 start_codon:yes stop_codon:yes gene_type:complete
MAVGYEFTSWSNMVNDLQFAEDTNPPNPIAQQTETQVLVIDRGNISFDGLFASVGFVF